MCWVDYNNERSLHNHKMFLDLIVETALHTIFCICIYMCTVKGLCMFVAVTILLAMSVYQIIVTDKLPPSSNSVPVIGKLDIW